MVAAAGSDTGEAAPSPEASWRPRFWHDLEARLGVLSSRNLKIAPSDRIAVSALAAELLSQGAVKTAADLDPYLAAILCRKREDYVAFSALPDTTIEQYWNLPGAGPAQAPEMRQEPTRTRAPRARFRRGVLAAAVLLVLALGALMVSRLMSPEADTPTGVRATTPAAPGAAPAASSPDSPDPERSAAPQTRAAETIARLASAARSYDGAPTLIEMSGYLAATSDTGLPADAYAQSLSELTGAPLAAPIDLFDVRDIGADWMVRLAIAIDRLEGADVATPGDYRSAASDFGDASRTLETAYDAVIAENDSPAGPIRLETERDRARALAFPDRPVILPAFDGQAAWRFPAWLKGLLAALPLLAAITLIYGQLQSDQAYLRRRKPAFSPLETQYAADILMRTDSEWNGRDKRLGKLLQARDVTETTRIDLEATVNATVRTGGRGVEIRYQRLQPAPEYLVLIERAAPGDQAAGRLRALLEPFERDRLVHFDVYYYENQPRHVRPEDGGSMLAIEALQAKHPTHRLVVLGTGRAFVDAANGTPEPIVDALRFWERRALLTPQPVRDWTRLQYALASALDAPVARATKDGFLNLGELLGLDGPGVPAIGAGRLDNRGDGFMRSLPDRLSMSPERLLYREPPEDYPLERLVRDVRDVLDTPGFDWLCSLAVYPALQWDLTLYLGVETGLYDDDPAGDRRLANLTRLLWLQRGRMPTWLRVALIDAMPLDLRGRVYAAINRILDPAEDIDKRAGPEVRLDIGRDTGTQDVSPEQLEARLNEDRVMIEFLARGDRGDYPLPMGATRRGERAWRQILKAGTTWRQACAGAGLAIGVWLVLPETGTPMETGGFLPVLAFAALALGLALPALRHGRVNPPVSDNGRLPADQIAGKSELKR